MKPSFEQLESRDCPSVNGSDIPQQLIVLSKELGVAVSADYTVWIQQIIIAEQAGGLDSLPTAQPIATKPLTNTVINGFPGQPQLLISPIQYDYGNGMVITSGITTEVSGSLTPPMPAFNPDRFWSDPNAVVQTFQGNPIITALPDLTTVGPNGESELIVQRFEADYGQTYGAVYWGQIEVQ